MYVRGSRGWWLARPVIISILSIVFVKLCRTPRAMVDRDIRFCNRYAFFPISFAFSRTLSDSLINWKWTGERKPWPCNRRKKDVETVSTDRSQITAAFNASCYVSFHSFFLFFLLLRLSFTLCYLPCSSFSLLHIWYAMILNIRRSMREIVAELRITWNRASNLRFGIQR